MCGQDWRSTERFFNHPIIGISEDCESRGSPHPSVIIVDDVIHIAGPWQVVAKKS